MLMSQQQALEVLAAHRADRIVVTTMSATGIWPALSNHPLDFHYIPSAMGHGSSLGMGLALAQPERGVIVVNGDGGMLMNLGSLVTLANYAPNVFLIVMDNGLYEVTGGQAVPGAGHTNFAELASAAGIKRVYNFDSLSAWQAEASKALADRGPVFIRLKVEGRKGQKTPKPPRPMSQQIASLRRALGIHS
jgi:thiamine pyrophosphate-dependent acetolactate synthase large subunit-like protein